MLHIFLCIFLNVSYLSIFWITCPAIFVNIIVHTGDSQEEFSDDDQTRPRVYSDRTEFKSRLDLNYYQNLLQEEQRKTDGSDKDRGQAVDMSNHLNQEMSKVFHVPDHSSLRDPSREPARIASSMQPGKDIHQGGENAQGEAEVLRPITNQTLNVDNYRNGSRIDPGKNFS